MYQTCKSCGTIFDLDESVLSNKIQWLKCSVCNEKWSLPSKKNEKFNKDGIKEDNTFLIVKETITDETEKVKNELASIKSVVEDKTKKMSKINNPILDIKNKSVAEISSELSASKLKVNDLNQLKTIPQDQY